MAGINRPAGKFYVDPNSGRITLEFDAFLSALVGAVNAVSQAGLVATKAYTVATVPSATDVAGRVIYVSDETGGAVLAFSDGTDWRRVTDRNVIS